MVVSQRLNNLLLRVCVKKRRPRRTNNTQPTRPGSSANRGLFLPAGPGVERRGHPRAEGLAGSKKNRVWRSKLALTTQGVGLGEAMACTTYMSLRLDSSFLLPRAVVRGTYHYFSCPFPDMEVDAFVGLFKKMCLVFQNSTWSTPPRLFHAKHDYHHSYKLLSLSLIIWIPDLSLTLIPLPPELEEARTSLFQAETVYYLYRL